MDEDKKKMEEERKKREQQTGMKQGDENKGQDKEDDTDMGMEEDQNQ